MDITADSNVMALLVLEVIVFLLIVTLNLVVICAVSVPLIHCLFITIRTVIQSNSAARFKPDGLGAD